MLGRYSYIIFVGVIFFEISESKNLLNITCYLVFIMGFLIIKTIIHILVF